MTLPKTTRGQIIGRANQGFGTGLEKVPYSQDYFVGGYRADCSGYVSRCLGLGPNDFPQADWWGGLNTVTLVTLGVLVPLGSPDDLLPGDVVGNVGPGTAGDAGHVAIFGGWLNSDPNDSHYWIYEQAGDTVGPLHRVLDWPYPGESRWLPYRYAGTIPPTPPPAAGGSPQEDDDMKVRFIRLKGTEPVYRTNQITRTWVPSPETLKAQQWNLVHVEGYQPTDVDVRDVDDLDAFGTLVVDPEHGTPPGVAVHGAGPAQ